MSRKIRMAIAQMEVIPGNPEKNFEKISSYIEQSKKENVEVLFLPNFCVAGEFNGYSTGQRAFNAECQEYYKEIRKAAGDIQIEYSDNESTKDSECPLIYVNAVGLQNRGKDFFVLNGGSKIFSPTGELVLTLPMFEEVFQIFEFDLGANFKCKLIAGDKKSSTKKHPANDSREMLFNTVFYGTKKFLEQLGINRVVVGISGGIDSAVSAALYTQVLGADNVLLVNMPSKFNSDTTKNLSAQLAKNLGCQYEIVPIQDAVDLTIKQISNIKNLDVSGHVKENIQARDRGARLLASIAAAYGGVFSCNANKTEMTLGYSTLYGDCAGFFAATGDLWKFQVYDLARYMNEVVYQHEVIPQGIIDITPSAELSAEQNVDEGKGDPLKYRYHDYLFRAFVEYQLTPSDILQFYATKILESQIGCDDEIVDKYFPTPELFIEDLERCWNSFRGLSVAKRLQSPPVLVVSEQPFGFTESQNQVYYTREYRRLKDKILRGEEIE